MELEDETRWADVVAAPVYRRWGRFMSDQVPANPDGTSTSEHLREVFRLEWGKVVPVRRDLRTGFKA